MVQKHSEHGIELVFQNRECGSEFLILSCLITLLPALLEARWMKTWNSSQGPGVWLIPGTSPCFLLALMFSIVTKFLRSVGKSWA